MGYIPPPASGVETDERPGFTALIAAILVIVMLAAVYGATAWVMASRADTTLTYVCQPGDTAVVRDGFGQHTPMCVTADGSTTYWPERVRVPTP